MTVTRGRFLAGLGAAGLLGSGGVLLGRAAAGGEAATVPFRGPHQAGIATPQQDHLLLVAFDVAPRRRETLRVLMEDWTELAARLTAGDPAGPEGAALAPPADTGEAGELGPGLLTITFGLGSGVFSREFGLDGMRPAAMVDLPAFPGERLDAARSGGDVCVQVCGDDPQVVFHALRNLIRVARGAAGVRWVQRGFLGRPAGDGTPRNLMGFRDGTNNVRGDDAAAMAEHVWADAPGWMDGGTYLVMRRIRILVEAWDRTGLQEQELLVGRRRASGAPIGGTRERDPVVAGRLDPRAHVRLASPDAAAGRASERMLRRGYNFADGLDPRTGQLDAGLVFIAFNRDPREQFVPVQRRLAASDGLNEYLVHTASALFCVPPGTGPGETVGAALFASARGSGSSWVRRPDRVPDIRHQP